MVEAIVQIILALDKRELLKIETNEYVTTRFSFVRVENEWHSLTDHTK